jgi:hypothetical protein
MTIRPGRIEEMAQAVLPAANGLPHHQDEDPYSTEAGESETAAPPIPVPEDKPASAAADPWPWPTKLLTARQEDVFEALKRRGLRPDCIVPAAVRREIAAELGVSVDTARGHLGDLRKRLGIADTSLPASPPDLSGNGNHGTRGDTPQPEPVAVEPSQEPQEPQSVSPIVEHAAAEVARQEAAERNCAAPAPPLPPLQSGQAMVQAETMELEFRAQVANLTDELRQAHIIGTEQALEIVEFQAQIAAQLRTIEAQARLNDRVRDENAALQDEVKRLTATAVDGPAPAEEPLTERQRVTALLLAAGEWTQVDGGAATRRRVLALAADLAADLAALAERR